MPTLVTMTSKILVLRLNPETPRSASTDDRAYVDNSRLNMRRTALNLRMQCTWTQRTRDVLSNIDGINFGHEQTSYMRAYSKVRRISHTLERQQAS